MATHPPFLAQPHMGGCCPRGCQSSCGCGGGCNYGCGCCCSSCHERCSSCNGGCGCGGGYPQPFHGYQYPSRQQRGLSNTQLPDTKTAMTPSSTATTNVPLHQFSHHKIVPGSFTYPVKFFSPEKGWVRINNDEERLQFEVEVNEKNKYGNRLL